MVLYGERIDIVPFYKYLGVYFTPKLVWTKTKEVAHQASKAVCRIFQYQKHFGNFPQNDSFKLFDSIVTPILCYGSDIWGFEYSKQIEKIHSQFCKRYIGLHQNAADFFALSECGRYPLAVTYMTQCIKYWVRLVQMPNHRYPKQCYNMLQEKSTGPRVFARYCTGTDLGTCGKQIRLKMVYILFICLNNESKIAICKNYNRKLKILPKHCNINILKQLLKLHTICMQTFHVCIKR